MSSSYIRSDSVSKSQRRYIACLLLVSVGIILALGTFIGLHLGNDQTEFAPETRVNLKETEANAGTDDPDDNAAYPRLRIAIAPVISPEKSLETYRDFVDYLGRKLDRTPIFQRGQNYSEVNNLLRLKQCDMAMVCTYAYVLGEREFGMKLLAIPQIRGETVYHSFIIVPKSSEISSLLDLRNKRFASSDVLSTSGWLYPMTWLKSQGLDMERFFSKHIISGSHDKSIYAVTAGIVDGAAVDSVVYQQMVLKEPGLGEETKVIQESPPFGMPPLVVPAGISPDLEAQMRTVLFNMHTDSDGKEILGSLAIDRFVAAQKTLYDSVQQLRASWEESQ